MYSTTLTTYLADQNRYFSDPLAAIMAIGLDYQRVLDFWAHIDTISPTRWMEEIEKWSDPFADPHTPLVQRWQEAGKIVTRHEEAMDYKRGGQLPGTPASPGTIARSLFAYVDTLSEDPTYKTTWNIYGLLRMATLELLLRVPAYTPFFLTLVPDMPEGLLVGGSAK